MIVKMKKVSLVLLKARKEQELRKLKKLGVVHLELEKGSSEGTAELEDIKGQVERAFYSLEKPRKGDDLAVYAGLEDALKKTREINAILDWMTLLKDENIALAKELDRVSALGEFDPSEVKSLSKKGWDLRLFLLNKEETAGFSDPRGFIVSRGKTGNVLALVTSPDDDGPSFSRIELPELSPAQMREKMASNQKSLEELKEKHTAFAGSAPVLKEALGHLDDELIFEGVRAGMGEEESLAYLTGWTPEDRVEELKQEAARSGWACLVKDAEPDEEPPTLVKNNRVIRIIAPIFDFLGTVPGYREYDVSFYFLVFFTLFVGMIIGDAGYGAILFLGAVLVSLKIKKVPDALKLLYVLSLAAVGWGAITGTWFASESLMEIPALQALVIEPLATLNPESGKTVMYVSFIIGLIHISIAHLKNIVKKLPQLVALADLGWLAMVIGLFYLVLNLVLDAEKYPMPPFATYLIGGGFAFLILFGQQEKGQNFFKGILKGVAGLLTTFLDCISCFGDIISYIRLYAVGLATVAISQTFNGMAAGMVETGAVGIVLAVLVLTLGHTLNVVMAILSVVVHGVRLNMLEFSGHLGMQWTGYGYQPFSERDKK